MLCDCGGQILSRVVAGGGDSRPPLRPQLDQLENCMDFVKETMRLCWAENPELRPDFKLIRSKLRPLRDRCAETKSKKCHSF